MIVQTHTMKACFLIAEHRTSNSFERYAEPQPILCKGNKKRTILINFEHASTYFVTHFYIIYHF